jgi:hypothetical protein
MTDHPSNITFQSSLDLHLKDETERLNLMMFKLVNEVKKYTGVSSLSEDYILIKFLFANKYKRSFNSRLHQNLIKVGR